MDHSTACDDESGLDVLQRELESRVVTADRRLARTVLAKARERQMWVTARELAVLVHLVEEPRQGLRNQNGFYVDAIAGMVGGGLHRLVESLEAGRISPAEAREMMYTGRTDRIKKAAGVWLDLFGTFLEKRFAG